MDDFRKSLIKSTLCKVLKRLHYPLRTWKLAANQFAIMFGERFTNAIN
ncbi:hypothetical protein [Undibacterium sp. WLX3042]